MFLALNISDILSQNIHKEGISRGTRDTNAASDTEAENTATGTTSEHPCGFSATVH